MEERKPVVGGPPPPPLGFSDGVRALGVRKVGCCCRAFGLGVWGVEDCCTLIERFNLVGESRRPVGGVDYKKNSLNRGKTDQVLGAQLV